MTSSYFRLSSQVKYLLTIAIAAFVTSNCAVLSPEFNILPNYESKTGLKFPQSIIDLACLTATFPSQFNQQQDENNLCFSQVLKNYTEIKHIDDLVYDEIDQSFISNTYPSLGIKGVHLKIFEKIEEKNNSVFVIIRHQEHESFITDEMNEMMSLFGPAATVDRQQGNKETFGAYTISSMIRFLRQQFGLDYLPQAISMLKKIQLHYHNQEKTKYIFSGFSSGGLYAIILALYFHWPAITFSATGVEDIVNIYYSNLFADKHVIPPIFNFAHYLDPVPQLDCQLGTLCLFQSENVDNQVQFTEQELQSLHLNTIFGQYEPHIIQWLRQPERWKCTTADDYNFIYGSCKRERLRWKDRMKFHSMDKKTNQQDL